MRKAIKQQGATLQEKVDYEGEFALYLLANIGGLYTGDIIFQLLTFLLIPVTIVVIVALFFVLRKRNERLKRVEEKLDKVLSEKENQVR